MKRFLFALAFVAAVAAPSVAFASGDKVLSVTCPSSVAAGAAVWIGNMENASVDVYGTFSQTMQVQSSIDGVTWTTEGSNVTSGAHRTVTANSLYVRCNTSVHVSGSATAKVTGTPSLNRKKITMTGIPAIGITGASTGMYVGDLDVVTVQVGGNDASTTQVQASVDGNVWTNISSAVANATGIVSVTAGLNYVRFNVTSATNPDAGALSAPTGVISGRTRPFSP